MIEYERILVDVFGEDWKMRLGAAGIVGGETAADEDRERVVELARGVRPDLGSVDLAHVGDAWIQWWSCAQEPGRGGPLKVLVATNETQGDQPGDFMFVPEGDLVARYGVVCDAERPDGTGGCGCGRSFGGFTTAKATTSAIVVERDMTEADWRAGLHEALSSAGWDQGTAEQLAEAIDDIALHDLEEIEDLPPGTVVGRRAWNEGGDLYDEIVVRRLGQGLKLL